MVKEISWSIPAPGMAESRAEKFSLLTVAVVVLFFSWVNLYSFFYALMFTGLFIGTYLVFGYVVQLIRQGEEKYHLGSTYLQVIRKTRFKSKKEKIPLKKIKLKLNRLFLSGKIHHGKKKHKLYFNNRDDFLIFKKLFKKHIN